MIGFEIFLAIGMFTAIVLGLVAIILVARAKLVSSGDVTIQINGEHSLTVPAGGKLLQTLAANNVFLSSACGGGGTCAQCKCVVVEGGGEMLPTEESHFTRRQAKEGWRLSCQTPVKQDMQIRVPEEVFGVKKWECTVESNPNVATFIKELTLRLPDGERGLSCRRLRAAGMPAARGRVQGLRYPAGISRRLGQVQHVALRVEGRRDGDPRLLDGQLPGREGRGQVQYPHRLAAAGQRPAAGADVVLGVQPQAGRQGHRVRAVRRVLRQGHRGRDGLHRRRRRHGADAFAHLRPVAPAQVEPQDQLLVRRALAARGLLYRGTTSCGRRTPTSSGTWRCPTRSRRTTGPA